MFPVTQYWVTGCSFTRVLSSTRVKLHFENTCKLKSYHIEFLKVERTHPDNVTGSRATPACFTSNGPEMASAISTWSKIPATSLPSPTEEFQLQALVDHNHLELVAAAAAVSPVAFLIWLGSKPILSEIAHWCCWEAAAANFSGEWGCIFLCRLFMWDNHLKQCITHIFTYFTQMAPRNI